MAVQLKGKSGKVYNIRDHHYAAGGEGYLHDIDSMKDHVAKIYLDKYKTEDRHRKLLTMIASPLTQEAMKQVTWPVDVLYENNRFVGYIMPRQQNNEKLNVMYSTTYINSILDKKIILAENLCAAVNAVHTAGQVVGDFNPGNILVSPTLGYVTLMDTDSYHITDAASGNTYRCEVGRPEYVPREVMDKMSGGMNLSNAPLPTYKKETDLFALATHIFALLMNGCHPFACALDLSINQPSITMPGLTDNIKSGMFPFVNPNSGITIPAYVPGFDSLSPKIQLLFRRAFIDGYNSSDKRPDSVEWLHALKEYRNNLKTCSSNNAHMYYNGLSKCPWCEVDYKFKQMKMAAPSNTLKQTKFAKPIYVPSYTPPAPPTLPPPPPRTPPPPPPTPTFTPPPPQPYKKSNAGKVVKTIFITVLILGSVLLLGTCISNFMRDSNRPRSAAVSSAASAKASETRNVLTASDLNKLSVPKRYYENEWDASSHKGSLYIGDKLYESGIGIFLISSQINEDKIGMAEVVYEIPSGVKKLSFVLGADGKWDYSSKYGTFCLNVFADDKEIYNSGWKNYKFTDNVELDITGCSKLSLKLQEKLGSKGTLNIVLGNFKVSR